MRRLTFVLLPAFGLAGAAFLIAIALPRILAIQSFPTTPAQPLYFDHSIHVQVAGLECAFCHRTADQGVTAGYPDVEQCLFCHQVIAEPRAAPELAGELAKVRQAWADQQPLNWTRRHLLPDHTRFPHDVHVQFGLTCATCHGEVGQMGQVVQVRSLKMGDCLACHRETGAPVHCGVCHY